MMARKGNQQRNGLNRDGLKYQNVVSEMVNKENLKSHDGKIAEEEPSSSPQEGKNNAKGSGKKNKQRSACVFGRRKSDDTNPNLSQTMDTSSRIRDPSGSGLSSGASGSKGNNEMILIAYCLLLLNYL